MALEVDAQKVYSELSQLREAVQSLKDRIELIEQRDRPSVHAEHPLFEEYWFAGKEHSGLLYQSSWNSAKY